MFGANASPYATAGDWQLNLSSRNLVSNDHYNGTAEQHERQERQNYITNRQNLFDVGVTRVLTPRVSVSVGVPFVYSAWAFRSPASPLPGPRVEEHAHRKRSRSGRVRPHEWRIAHVPLLRHRGDAGGRDGCADRRRPGAPRGRLKGPTSCSS